MILAVPQIQFIVSEATGFFSYAASLGATVDRCIALLGVVLRPLVPGSHLFDAGFT